MTTGADSPVPPEAVDVVTETERAQVLLHPARLRILDALREPSSATALARRLDQPRQLVNYHLRELEAQRLVALVATRTRGSVSERVYQRTGNGYAISIDALGSLGVTPETVHDRYSSAYQVALASRAIADLAALRAGAAAANQPLATFALDVVVRFADAAARSAFAQELADAVASLVRRYHDDRAPAGRSFRCWLGIYPERTNRA